MLRGIRGAVWALARHVIMSATLTAVVTDVADSLRQAGVGQLVVVEGGHGGNYVLSNVVQEANVGGRRMALYPGRHDWEEPGELPDWSALVMTTCTRARSKPHYCCTCAPTWCATATRLPTISPIGRTCSCGACGYTTSGVIGQPSSATADKGKAVLDSLTASFADTLAVLRGPTQ